MSAAARSVFRSTSTTRNAAARLAGGAKPKAARSPFRIPTQKPLSSRIFRSPVEMRFVCVDSLLPFHTATASALLTSMLSATPRCYGWTPEGIFFTLFMYVCMCLGVLALIALHNIQ
ncbi:hypothetical protein HYC85_018460 [Camellia sinensis]|uniref:Protein NUCLEAR FUSION DEFECTIVE 6, chloroplastic/mitochondrial-like n=1 Tax=Camellia sinensis TaxID=4442 RepID=A0A7J7GUC3_CAMSI|nr:hypothetical protein HYC85_018460 [Camellia sinensis]